MNDRKSPGLHPEIAKNALLFLSRCQVIGSEVDAYLQVRSALEAIVTAPVAPAASVEPPDEQEIASALRAASVQ